MPNNALQLFDYKGQSVRTVLDERTGEPWWIARDVCDVLDIQNTHVVLRGLDDDEKGRSTVPTLGGDQVMTSINEPGLYSLILRSRKPEAKAFKRWITHEVIPAIRKTGSYGITSAATSAIPQTYSEALRLAADLSDKVEALSQDVDHLTGMVTLAENQIERDAPKVEGYKAFLDSSGLYSLKAAAGILGTGRTRFTRALRQSRIFVYTHAAPYQKFIDRGYFDVRSVVAKNGTSYPTTKVTPVGLEWLRVY